MRSPRKSIIITNEYKENNLTMTHIHTQLLRQKRAQVVP